jgi:tRNA threonylcarbamoyl adenosine modification protein (Sua5/YciO/YrdC/YwlC family)
MIITKEKFDLNDENILRLLKEGIFIYPTDTIYGIGCNALNDALVERVRKIKQRPDTPFSVIVPSKKWIFDNCDVKENAKEWIDKLPGHYTLILKLKKKDAIAANVSKKESIGARIPFHWFSKVVEKLGFPIVTTSVNLHGEKFMTSIDDLDDKLKSEVDLIVYEGEKKGNPSVIVDLTEDAARVTNR